jgi:hypothetical protein
MKNQYNIKVVIIFKKYHLAGIYWNVDKIRSKGKIGNRKTKIEKLTAGLRLFSNFRFSSFDFRFLLNKKGPG